MKFAVAVAARLVAVGGQKIGPPRTQVAGDVFDDEGQRIDRLTRLVKKLRVVEVSQRRLGQVLMPAEFGFDVGEHGTLRFYLRN